MPPSIRPLDWLIALGMVSGLSAREARARGTSALERVKLPAIHWRKSVSTYSKGMKQRVKLAQCLLHDPRLVILDEPMNGLDPMGREEMANVLRDLAANGASVVISSHILQDLEALCREFILLRWGRMPKAGNATANPLAADDGGPVPANGRPPRSWPAETTLRCDAPDQLARFFFERGLLRGCDIDPDTETLVARWRDPAEFYEHFHQHLLESGVAIHEVSAKGSKLERAIEPPPLP